MLSSHYWSVDRGYWYGLQLSISCCILHSSSGNSWSLKILQYTFYYYLHYIYFIFIFILHCLHYISLFIYIFLFSFSYIYFHYFLCFIYFFRASLPAAYLFFIQRHEEEIFTVSFRFANDSSKGQKVGHTASLYL